MYRSGIGWPRAKVIGMVGRRSPLAVLVHVLALLAMCVVGRVGPATSAAHAAGRPAVNVSAGSSYRTAAFRSGGASAEVRTVRGLRSGAEGPGPDVLARPPSFVVAIAPPAVTRLAVSRSAPQGVVAPSTREPTARGPPPIA
jgi:hypothetical protein